MSSNLRKKSENSFEQNLDKIIDECENSDQLGELIEKFQKLAKKSKYSTIK